MKALIQPDGASMSFGTLPNELGSAVVPAAPHSLDATILSFQQDSPNGFAWHTNHDPVQGARQLFTLFQDGPVRRRERALKELLLTSPLGDSEAATAFKSNLRQTFTQALGIQNFSKPLAIATGQLILKQGPRGEADTFLINALIDSYTGKNAVSPDEFWTADDLPPLSVVERMQIVLKWIGHVLQQHFFSYELDEPLPFSQALLQHFTTDFDKTTFTHLAEDIQEDIFLNHCSDDLRCIFMALEALRMIQPLVDEETATWNFHRVILGLGRGRMQDAHIAFLQGALPAIKEESHREAIFTVLANQSPDTLQLSMTHKRCNRTPIRDMLRKLYENFSPPARIRARAVLVETLRHGSYGYKYNEMIDVFEFMSQQEKVDFAQAILSDIDCVDVTRFKATKDSDFSALATISTLLAASTPEFYSDVIATPNGPITFIDDLVLPQIENDNAKISIQACDWLNSQAPLLPLNRRSKIIKRLLVWMSWRTVGVPFFELLKTLLPGINANLAKLVGNAIKTLPAIPRQLHVTVRDNVVMAEILVSVSPAYDDPNERFALLKHAAELCQKALQSPSGLSALLSIASLARRWELTRHLIFAAARHDASVPPDFLRSAFPETHFEDLIAEHFFDFIVFGGKGAYKMLEPYLYSLARDEKNKGFLHAHKVDLIRLGFSEKAASVWSSWSELKYFYGYFDYLKIVNAAFAVITEEGAVPPSDDVWIAPLVEYLSYILEKIPPTLNRFKVFLPLLQGVTSHMSTEFLSDFLYLAKHRIDAYFVDSHGRPKSQRDIHVIEDELALFRKLQRNYLVAKMPEDTANIAMKIFDSQDVVGKKNLENMLETGFLDAILAAVEFLDDGGRGRLGRVLTQMYESKKEGANVRYANLKKRFENEFIMRWSEEAIISVTPLQDASDSNIFLVTQTRQLQTHNQPSAPTQNKFLTRFRARIAVFTEALAMGEMSFDKIHLEASILLDIFNENHQTIRENSDPGFFEVKNDLKVLLSGLANFINQASAADNRNYTLEVSGKPSAFARAGVSPTYTCQRLRHNTGHNVQGQPFSRMLHGQFKVAFLKRDKADLARVMLEITKNAQNESCLLVERYYVAAHFGDTMAFRQSLIDYAATLGIPVTRVYFPEQAPQAPKPFFVKDPVYRDSFGERSYK